MKYRTKRIIKAGILVFRILLLVLFGISETTNEENIQIDHKNPIRYVLLLLIITSIVLIIYRYNNYTLLDDEWITQIKQKLLSPKTSTTITYKDILEIHFERNNRLSEVDVGKDHYISSTSWKVITIWKIFHFRKFKKTLEEKRLLMNKNIWNIKAFDTWNIFLSNEWWFIKLEKEKILISKYHDWKHSTLSIKYQDIEQIEVVIVEEDNTCIYVKLKNQKLKEVFYGIKDWNAFMNAIKIKWIPAYFVSSDEIISDLKEEDLY